MSSAILTSMIVLLGQIAPLVQQGSNIAKIIDTLITLLPELVKVGGGIYQAVKNIIQALQANPDATEEIIARLRELDAQVDADFEAAAAIAEAEDKAP